MEPSPNAMPRRSFVLATLLIWLLFLLIAIPQWMIMCLYAENPLVYTVLLLIIGFTLLACIHVFETLKYSRPWNILCLLICYEILTVGISLYLTQWALPYTLVLIGVGIGLSGLVLFISWIMIIFAAYPNPTKIAILCCLGFVLVFCIRSVDLFNNFYFLRDIEVFVFMTSIFSVMICHILITNDNFDLLRRDDAMHVAFVLHVCFMMFMVGGRVAVYCVLANLEYYDSKITTLPPQKMVLGGNNYGKN